MHEDVHIDHTPELAAPLLVFGFDGWANGGNAAIGTIDYLVRKLGAMPFARIDPDNYYRFDESRPVVQVQEGRLREMWPPEMVFYAASQEETGKDCILFKAKEPHLRWFSFSRLVSALAKDWGTRLVVGLGGLQDNLLHTDAVVSGLASNDALLDQLKRLEVTPIDYEGPGAIHSLILKDAEAMGIPWLSLWGHCPFYMQGSHLRLLSRLTNILTEFSGLDVDTTELEKGWVQLARGIQRFIDDNPELKEMVTGLVKAKRGASPSPEREDRKVIYLDDFLRPKG